MKLIHPDLHFQIEFTEQIIPIFLVESPVRWRELQKELILQCRGEDGNWVLSEENKEIKMSKSVEMVLNPLLLDENERRIVNAFLHSFQQTATNEFYWKMGQDLKVSIQNFFSEMEVEFPFDYHINQEIDFSALAKAM